MTTKSKVAVIGLGNIGKTLAKNLVKGNRQVIIASRNLDDAQTLAHELGNLATAVETKEAIKTADIIILSVWFNTIHELLNAYANELQGKISLIHQTLLPLMKMVASKKSLVKKNRLVN